MRAAFLALLLLAAPAAAEVTLVDAVWKLFPARQRAKAGAPPTLTRLARGPDVPKAAVPKGVLGAEVLVKNDGARPAVGVLVRYAVSAQLAPIKGPRADSLWTLPFQLDEVRIPRIAPGATRPADLRRLALDAFLKRVRSEGFWPTALRLQVMIEPKSGERLEGKLLEIEIPVDWKETP